MVIDLDRCSACQACVVACQAENNVAIIGPKQSEKGRTIHWIELIPYIEGEYPHIKARLLPRPCMHCDNPPCTKVCPVMPPISTRRDWSPRSIIAVSAVGTARRPVLTP